MIYTDGDGLVSDLLQESDFLGGLGVDSVMTGRYGYWDSLLGLLLRCVLGEGFWRSLPKMYLPRPRMLPPIEKTIVSVWLPKSLMSCDHRPPQSICESPEAIAVVMASK